MEKTKRKIECYHCGKINESIFFCNEICHEAWKKDNPVPETLVKRNRTIEDYQKTLKIMADESRKGWKPNRDVSEIEHDEVVGLFS